MRRLALTLVLLGSVVLSVPAHASSNPPSIDQIVRMARASVVVPTEWDGIWTTLDSVYTCAGVFQSTSTSEDTICGGKDFTLGTDGSPFAFTCNGSSNATTFDMTCTASVPVITDCSADYTLVMHGTLTGSTSHLVSTLTLTYTGTGLGCDLLPGSCTQTDGWGTRTGPAPSSYCTTPVMHSTWGHVKAIYR